MLQLDKGLRQMVVSAFVSTASTRPIDGCLKNGVDSFDAFRLLEFEPAWVVSDEDVQANRHGLGAMTSRGFRYVLGRILLYCIDHPNSDVTDSLMLYVARANPVDGVLRHLTESLTFGEADVLRQCLVALASERNADETMRESFELAVNSSLSIAEAAKRRE